MMSFSIQDNTGHKSFEELKWDVGPDDLVNLKKLANLRLSSKTNAHLIYFPGNDYKSRDNRICFVDDTGIKTYNILGYVGINGTNLSITSRFSNEKEGKDYFFHYMLQKVLKVNVTSLNFNEAKKDDFDFLIYLFPSMLEAAYRQGMFKDYVIKKYNDANVKGVIDVPRHIKLNPVFTGKIAYNTQEHCYDNNVTQLVRHTIEFIRTKEYFRNVLNRDKVTIEAVKAIINATPTYRKQDRQKVVNVNLRPAHHPYFSAYSRLQTLCMAILNHKSLSYGMGNNQFYGVLIDGAWLWEEYLNTILKECGFEHTRNVEGKDGKFIFSDKVNKDYTKHYVCFPDFYKPKVRNKKLAEIVLDAKYKRKDSLFPDSFDGNERKDYSDLYQIISYLHILKAKKAGLIYPTHKMEFTKQDARTPLGELNGYGGNIHILSFPIPKNAENMKCFKDIIEKRECDLINKVNKIYSLTI